MRNQLLCISLLGVALGVYGIPADKGVALPAAAAQAKGVANPTSAESTPQGVDPTRRKRQWFPYFHGPAPGQVFDDDEVVFRTRGDGGTSLDNLVRHQQEQDWWYRQQQGYPDVIDTGAFYNRNNNFNNYRRPDVIDTAESRTRGPSGGNNRFFGGPGGGYGYGYGGYWRPTPYNYFGGHNFNNYYHNPYWNPYW